MSSHPGVLSRKIIFIAVLIVLLAGIPVQTASAALRTCRTDPIVSLSNGSKVALSVTMGTHAGNVNAITYELHVPEGVTVTKIVYTGGEIAKKESVTVVADQPGNTYTSDTVVTVYNGNAEVFATTSLLVGIKKTVKGHSGEHLQVTLIDPGNAPRNTLRPARP